ncbi:hypothetical protein TSAR_005505 [Trichomalopsis sarcophagae]|uniref:Uncharacterized protein n=1 Tax=Trichomalopsis sarcophagae TaxID=543379 RepID=A0A232FBU5_9HYME|nr:hypothetical protein TSAR_005505 [Trichomalopsis sarcophagae]
MRRFARSSRVASLQLSSSYGSTIYRKRNSLPQCCPILRMNFFEDPPVPVLNLNLSNLLLLLVLKAVVYGAGYIGNHAFKRRGDVVENNILSEGETALALGYLMGDNCLYQAACEVPHTAKEYLGAAEIVFQTINLLPRSIPIGDSYEQTMTEFRKAIDHGLKDQCPSDYSCKKENIHRFLRPQ